MAEFLKTEYAITDWLKKYNITEYELIPDETYGFVVNVSRGVSLSGQKLIHIPVKFNQVNGHFYCHHNELSSLRFCPSSVGGSFYCHYNELTSLEFCPDHVRGDFDCGYNQLTSLEYCPDHVGRHFYCSHNQLKSLEFCPTHVDGYFDCSYNELTSLEFCPAHVSGRFNGEKNPLLQEIQDITYFKKIYQHHQETKIRLAKECLEEKLSDQPIVSSSSSSKMKI